MAAAAPRRPTQVVGVDQKMRRHLVSREFLYKESLRAGLLGQVFLLRRLTPVKCVASSWRMFFTLLTTRKLITSRS
ncbi:hypothetical protein G5576_018650 [Homo sapiens]|uniref:Uncharacterized protein n=1 Tax=Homo sapiens TaxID=9606 RepID=M0QXF5_HUMAN|nr:hypothetical protein KI723_192038 [Homo sapiens]KAI4045224.1 hypothetical protein G5576_018650 [Homo sapiens]